jgi:uncharacterized membrane protein YGL010W
MAIARFLKVACFSARLSVRRSLPCFDGLKLNLLSPNLLMAKLLMEIGLNPTLQASVTSSTHNNRESNQERVKV